MDKGRKGREGREGERGEGGEGRGREGREGDRLFHIMLLKSPIMLFSNAAKCSLLCYQTFPIIPRYALNKSVSLVFFVILQH